MKMENKLEILNYVEDLLIKRYGFENLSGNVGLAYGYLNSDLFFVGMNPGKRHNKREYGARCLSPYDLKPENRHTGGFIFLSLLNKYHPNNYYNSNLVKIPTENNQEPSDKLVKIFLPYLKLEMAIIKPKLIISLGNWVYQTLTNNNIKSIKIYHPSYIARFENKNKIIEYEKTIKNLRNYLENE